MSHKLYTTITLSFEIIPGLQMNSSNDHSEVLTENQGIRNSTNSYLENELCLMVHFTVVSYYHIFLMYVEMFK